LIVTGIDSGSNSGGKIYVAANGQPYILKIALTGSSGTGTLSFSHYNKPVRPVAPPHAIDLDTLGSTTTTAG
jgi:hypothetical protein